MLKNVNVVSVILVLREFQVKTIWKRNHEEIHGYGQQKNYKTLLNKISNSKIWKKTVIWASFLRIPLEILKYIPIF